MILITILLILCERRGTSKEFSKKDTANM